jgi:hypothetical protein
MIYKLVFFWENYVDLVNKTMKNENKLTLHEQAMKLNLGIVAE